MIRYNLQTILLFAFLFLSFSVRAQNNKTGVFGIATVVLPGDSLHRWGGYAELQTRSDKPFDQFFYYETKAGISFDLDKSFTALLGTGRYVTNDNPENLKVSKEFRLWEQMTINQFLYRVKLEHRYRVEQRWVNGIYRNRFRYRLNLFVPLNNTKIVAGTYFISVYDELFMNNAAPHFERNRFSAALGYQFNNAINVQAGWLNQYNYSPTFAADKNNLALTFMYRINRKNALPREHMPSTGD
ncbi:DUF2490 domain-containing protein [Mucilaginibacter sp. UR6-11]|uniref:DUF2490 domain-containing protein n=1 Tax=Mucilaginibacter sp. UR6-11 TaxID=1435644 RepID=UPI001E622D64|nr:DUF2490 domain-containing protein [Mucilaginibacter sp. UR6-11]MCC8424036.1 DUF2490 domain-containing protein [Mucilaginibacter sp. UR6-11]